MISLKMGAVGPKNAGRIWGFLSKFVMLDRFGKTLGVAEIYPGIPLPRSVCSPEYLGTAGKVSIPFLTSELFLLRISDIRRPEPSNQNIGKIYENLGRSRKE